MINAIKIIIGSESGAGNFLYKFDNNFKKRVIADGGTFEAPTCLYNFLNRKLSKYRVQADYFSARVVADGGVFEAQQCLVNFISI